MTAPGANPAQSLAAQVTAVLARDIGRTDADLAALLDVPLGRLTPVIGMLYRRGLADRCGPYIVAPATPPGRSRDSRDSRDIAGQGRHSLKGVTAGAVTLTSGRAFGAQTPLTAALGYAALGWPVFWLGKSKRPVVNCKACPKGAHDPASCGHLTCHGFHAASTDPARITAMRRAVPGGLLAIRTGTASGLAVVDIDPRNGGQVHGDLMTPTAAVATGGGGWHLYYRHPGIRLLPELPGHPGVDIKADGGYAVAPPSPHPGTGKPYQWAAPRAVSEMAPALRAALTPPDPPPVPAVPLTASTATTRAEGAGAISDPAALLASLLRAVERAPEGARRRTLYGAARGVARMVNAAAITPEHAIAALTAAGHAAGQSPRQVRDAITDAFQAEGAPARASAALSRPLPPRPIRQSPDTCPKPSAALSASPNISSSRTPHSEGAAA